MEEFVTQRLIVPEGQDTPPVSFSSRMRKVNAPTFANLYDVPLGKSKKAEAAEVISANRSILQRLVTAYDAKRPVDLKEVAAHELMSVPITICQPNGSIRSGIKSTMIVPLIGDLQYTPLPLHPPDTSSLILDMMARVQSIGLPKLASNFGDLADVFVASVLASGRDFYRIEAVGDRYRDTSIKDCTRIKRTKSHPPSVRKAIDSRDVPLPTTKKEYGAFLSVKENKTELQRFLGEELLAQAPADKLVVAAGVFEDEREIRCSQQAVETQTLCANHEEADTRIVLHCVHSVSDFFVIAARDTDIIVILCAHQHLFPNKSVYVTMGNKQYLNAGALATKLGPDICNSLLVFHSLTGCDTVSFLYGIGKPIAIKTLLENPGLLQGISSLQQLSDEALANMELFVCKLYGNKSLHTTDGLRETMLLSSSKPELMPPTSNALRFHMQRAFYQARIWQCANIALPEIPIPTSPGAGWSEDDGKLQPILMTKDPIPKAIRVIIACLSCSTGCNTARCKCFKAELFCTRLCHRNLEHGVCLNNA